jgi:hypothetical protein
MNYYKFRVYDTLEKDYFSALTALYPENSTQGFFSASFLSGLGDECKIEYWNRLIFEQYIRMQDKEQTDIFEGDIILSQYNIDVGFMDPYISTMKSFIIVDSMDTFLYNHVYQFCFNRNVYHTNHEDKRSIFEVCKETRSKDFLVIGDKHRGLKEKYKQYQAEYEKSFLKKD